MAAKQNKTANIFLAKAGEVQGKVKVAAGKAGVVVKQNALVAVASGKILASGLQQIGSANIADNRKAVAVLSADFKALAKVKSVPEMLRLQGEQTARSIETFSAAANRNVADLRELVAGKVVPLIKGRVKANLELFRKAA